MNSEPPFIPCSVRLQLQWNKLMEEHRECWMAVEMTLSKSVFVSVSVELRIRVGYSTHNGGAQPTVTHSNIPTTVSGVTLTATDSTLNPLCTTLPASLLMLHYYILYLLTHSFLYHKRRVCCITALNIDRIGTINSLWPLVGNCNLDFWLATTANKGIA